MIIQQVRSSYSFMKGFGHPKDFVKRAQEVGGLVVAADYCSTWGHLAWQEAGCSGLGVTLPATTNLEKDPRHGLVTLIANSQKGLEDLYGLVTLANDQMYYRPRLKWSQIEGDVTAIIDEVLTDDIRDAFKATNYYFVKPRHSILNDISGYGQGIAAADARYVRPENRETYKLVSKMAHAIGDVEGDPTHMLREREHQRMMAQYGVTPDPSIYDQHFEWNAFLPKAKLLHVEGSLEDELRRSPRWLDEPAYRERVNKELALIREKGFESYFLFVADLVKWARRRMLVGPGRGSAGGSLVCYILGITEVDPLVHGTLFERFIDPGRPDLPDIDVDFADAERDFVFDYLRSKYGADRVARIGTLSEFGGKSAINDVGRVHKTPFNVLRSITGVLDDFSQANAHLATVEYALGHEDNQEHLKEHPELRDAELLEGHPRHTGVHAAGVIVADEPIKRFGALKEGVVALDMKMAEKLGLMKMDALGLKTLSVIAETMKLVGRNPYEIYKLPLDDEKVWELFNEDRVTGVFQFEGQAVRGLMRRVRVGNFEDLCALTSLARPGPLSGGAADRWISRKAGEEKWEALIGALNNTYGLIVYQEQAMSVVREVAGFDEYEVNGFRRAIGKKDPVKLASYREKFIGQGKGLTPKELETLWAEMEDFGSYAFNYSHAVAYSMISYYTAYLKAYYPNEFAVSYLKFSGDEDSQRAMLRELKAQVVFFDPDLSEIGWSIKDGKLIGGFTNVTGIGPKVAAEMIAMRRADPDGWKDKLTASQRKRLNNPTPFDDLHYFSDNYGDVYENPGAYRIKNKVWQIEDIPAERGDYTFLGRLTKIMEKEKVEGQPYALLFFSDDTGEMPCTINRFKWPDFKIGADGKPVFKIGLPYVVRGNIISDGRKWLFIEKARELHGTTKDQDQQDPRGSAGGTGERGDCAESVDSVAGTSRPEGDSERPTGIEAEDW